MQDMSKLNLNHKKTAILAAILALFALMAASPSVWAGGVSFPADLRSTTNQANYLIITADAFYQTAYARITGYGAG